MVLLPRKFIPSFHALMFVIRLPEPVSELRDDGGRNPRADTVRPLPIHHFLSAVRRPAPIRPPVDNSVNDQGGENSHYQTTVFQ